MIVSCEAVPCPVILSAACVFYKGENLIYTGINMNDNLQTALEKIDGKFQDAGIGYIFENGIIQLNPGEPVRLGGSLMQNTVINSAGFTFTISGSIQSGAHITTGGTSSQFVKGDGSLDSTVYQPAGAYITGLTGDGVATGPGNVPLTLATVNSNPGTYGNALTVPRITVNGKGLVTNITPVTISIPADTIVLVGDVSAVGTTGSNITTTLATVNSNVYGANTFLKFAVNAKGLVTSAAPVTIGDITSVLGFMPVPDSRTLTINGLTRDLTADRTWNVGTVTSVQATVPPAFSVTSAPITSFGTIDIVANGNVNQYIRGDGALAALPFTTSGTSGTSGSSGTSGTSGTSGSSGTSATDGTSGTSGTTGTSGTSGSTGTSGTSGTTGTSGTSATDGTSGTSGTSGTTGTSGTSGTTGTSGTSGTTGTDGTSGTSGTTGTSGTSGTTGTSGTSGTTGTDGTSGSSGTSGTTGTSGTSGTTGTSGTSGTTGTDGTSGTSGSTGTSGTSGSTGTSGSSGSSGVDGTFLGSSGTSGTSGINGSIGPNGTNGTSGTSGVNGNNGADGTNGTSGTSGVNGGIGPNGTNGTSGTSGVNGNNGNDGTNGTSGTSGLNGGPGADGTNGTSGTSGTGFNAVNNPATNRVLTANGASTNSANAQTNLTFDGSTLAVTGAITATGDITAFFSSDRRFKDDIVPIENALDKILKLNGVKWKWNDNAGQVTKSTPSIGLIAQEVQEVLPEVVAERLDGYLALDYAKITGVLIEAIKEQQIQIEQLKLRIDGTSK